MSAGRRDGRGERELQAWLDGELGLLGRRRMARRLARDPAARETDAFWREIRARLQEEARETPEPDLWPALRARLPAEPAAGRAPAPPRMPARLRAAVPWVGAGLAAAAAALALAVGLSWRDAPAAGSLRWLDTEGKPAMVLQDDGEATIIWVLDTGTAQSGRRGDRALG